MGAIDEHWCSKCKRSVDKVKEEYLELTALNDPAVLELVCSLPKNDKEAEDKPDVGRFAKGIMCEACAKKVKVEVEEDDGKVHKRTLWVFLKDLRKKGNPEFHVGLKCCPTEKGVPISLDECETHETPSDEYEHQNCAHIAVDLLGRLYCKRRHPGGYEVVMEEAVIERQKRDMMFKFILKLMKENPALAAMNAEGSKEAQAALLKALDMNPDLLHEPDPDITGADMGGYVGGRVETFKSEPFHNANEEPVVITSVFDTKSKFPNLPEHPIAKTVDTLFPEKSKVFDARPFFKKLMEADTVIVENLDYELTDVFKRLEKEGKTLAQHCAIEFEEAKQPKCFECKVKLDEMLVCPKCKQEYVIPYRDFDSMFMSKKETHPAFEGGGALWNKCHLDKDRCKHEKRPQEMICNQQNCPGLQRQSDEKWWKGHPGSMKNWNVTCPECHTSFGKIISFPVGETQVYCSKKTGGCGHDFIVKR